MRLLAYDPYLSSEKAKEMEVSLCDSLPELLKESD